MKEVIRIITLSCITWCYFGTILLILIGLLQITDGIKVSASYYLYHTLSLLISGLTSYLVLRYQDKLNNK